MAPIAQMKSRKGSDSNQAGAYPAGAESSRFKSLPICVICAICG